MDIFFKVTAAVLMAVILYLVLGKQDKELAILLSLGVCCMITLVGGSFIQPVLDFLQELQAMAGLDDGFLTILLKVVGIGFLAETVSLVCSDAGNSAMGKTLQFLASFVIVWLSIPVLSSLMSLVRDILGEV